MVTKVINLDLKDPNVVPAIHVTKLDSGLRAFEFHLYDGAEEYAIPTTASITFQGTKPDKNGFVYGCAYNNNVVTVNCTEQMTAVVGQTRCNLVIVDADEKRVASFLLYLHVLPTAVDDSTVISESNIAYANEVINELQSIGAYGDRLSALERKTFMNAEYVTSTKTIRFYKM